MDAPAELVFDEEAHTMSLKIFIQNKDTMASKQ